MGTDYKLEHYMLNATGAVFTLDELEDLYNSEEISFADYINSVKFTEDFSKVYPKNIKVLDDCCDGWFSYDDAFKALTKIVKALNLLDWELDNSEWFLINLKHQKKNITSIMYDLIENVEVYCTDEKKITFDE